MHIAQWFAVIWFVVTYVLGVWWLVATIREEGPRWPKLCLIALIPGVSFVFGIFFVLCMCFLFGVLLPQEDYFKRKIAAYAKAHNVSMLEARKKLYPKKWWLDSPEDIRERSLQEYEAMYGY